MLEPPDLRTEEIVLRPWQGEDLDAIVDELQDPEIPRWTRIPEPYRAADGRAFLAHSARRWSDGTGASFAIVDRATDHIVGSIGVRFLEQGGATVGYWVASAARGRGLATTALRLVSRWVIEELSVERLELVTEPQNLASQRVAEKAGFEREGVLRRQLVVKGERRDCVMFSLLPDDLD